MSSWKMQSIARQDGGHADEDLLVAFIGTRRQMIWSPFPVALTTCLHSVTGLLRINLVQASPQVFVQKHDCGYG